MRTFSYCMATIIAVAGLSMSGAHAQTMPGMSGNSQSMGGMMGNMASGAMGSMLPNVSSASSGNIAGVLSYCVQNNYVSGSGATQALGGLTSQQGVTSSGDYTAGQQGQLLTGGNSPFSLASLKSGLRQKVCNMVLSRAQNLL